MKKKEVPQDDEGLLEGKFREPCYAVDEEGNYIAVPSTGWAPKNAALKQAWEEINMKTREAAKDVLEGRSSILVWHMEKKIMDLKLLSQYSGISRRKIRKHLKPDAFSELDTDTMQKYADAFNITLEELTNMDALREKE
ncbi:MAG: helix-turn-helix transcriptional regulator [Bacteroidales bacterium]|nr:helix-turn-helix transcriptional regulator [Bacteroidales bacterium]